MLINVHKCSFYLSKEGDWVTNSHTYMRKIEQDGAKLKRSFLTEQDLARQWNEQRGLCYWLRIPMDLDYLYTTNNALTPSVDRKDLNLDYTADNIIITTRFANLGRGTTSFEDSRMLFDIVLGRTKISSILDFCGKHGYKSF